MTEKPIQFPALHADEMIQAILERRKTQHRVPVKPQPSADSANCSYHPDWWPPEKAAGVHFNCTCGFLVSPFGGPGDRLSVRECYLPRRSRDGLTHVTAYRADGYELESGEQWVPSTNMPRDASRIMQEVCEVRRQQVQDISDAESLEEGIRNTTNRFGSYRNYMRGWPRYLATPRKSFATLWDSIYAGKGLGWAENPWVWAGTFKRIET